MNIPDKIFIQTIASGVDFLGWINFPDHRVLRTTTKKRMGRRIRQNPADETLQSYLGMLRHGNSRKIISGLLNDYWLWQTYCFFSGYAIIPSKVFLFIFSAVRRDPAVAG